MILIVEAMPPLCALYCTAAASTLGTRMLLRSLAFTRVVEG
jgi:hypothetical protein